MSGFWADAMVSSTLDQGIRIMKTNLESITSHKSGTPARQASGWLRLGIVAAASTLAAGLATAWWYRKTLGALREAESGRPDPESVVPGEDPTDEV